MNIIFLDIDGVLNYGYEMGKEGFEPVLVENLKSIISEIKNVKIVISSSWRLNEKRECVSTEIPWRDVLERMIGCPGIIIGSIPIYNEFHNGRYTRMRGEDISLWIDTHRDLNIEKFVILDDSCSCGTAAKLFPNNIVICDKVKLYEGLSDRNRKQAVWILTGFGKDRPMVDNVFFISDTHFFHENIIKYCARPFTSAEEMNEKLIEKWNSTVGKNDTVWHLGDFCLGGKDNLPKIFGRLNGKINLVLGNHDYQKINFYYDIGFNRVYDRPVIINNFIILSHAPLEWIQAPMFNIFGHVHDNKIYNTFSERGCCVCVERHDYSPVSWKTIKTRIENLKNQSA